MPLDEILALQLTVAWAGEGRCVPPRLGWWQTDLIDPSGGGDLFARLTPRTAAWAGLEAALEAARRVDTEARKRLADPDRLRTLFHLGFEIDERLADRLAQLKRGGIPPAQALAVPLDIEAPFARDALTAALQLDGSGYSVVPGGRRLKGEPPADPETLVRNLASALVPLVDTYPLPFYTVTE